MMITKRLALLTALLLPLLPALAHGQAAFQAGFARMSITPDLPDTWTDANQNSVYEPDKGDTFTDGNGALREALTFHASFDGQVDAAFALGDPRFYTAPSWDDRAYALPRLPLAATAWWSEGNGRFGDALSIDNYEDMIFFFKADQNIAYNDQDWSGTVSFWLRLSPDQDLQPNTFSDPIQITPRSWDDASLFVDFTRESPRQFRFAAFADTKIWNPSGENWEELPDGAMPMIPIDNPPFDQDQWTHVVMTFTHFNTGAKDGLLTAYLNGKRVGELTGREQTLTWDPAQTLILIGIQYNGYFDDLAFFNRALNDEEVKTLYELDSGVATLSR